jgi:hypothetical protein
MPNFHYIFLIFHVFFFLFFFFLATYDRNKIRTWVCPSGCLTVKDDKTQTYAMMCHHTGESKLGYRLANPEKNNSRISRCYYGGCNGDNLDTFLGRAADSGSAKTSQNVLAAVVVTSVAAALL